jgi:predicted nucleotidyltransferase
MSQSELLRHAIEILDQIQIPYMVTGSLASSLYGEPRSTHDIDMLVELKESHISELLSVFSAPEYYLTESSIRQAIQAKRMFNLLELSTGDKIDFWIVTDDKFDQTRFQRRIRDEIEGVALSVSTPEDTILMKLRWSIFSGGSEKQFQDALRVFEVQYGVMDHQYLNHWVEELKIEELWRRLVAEAEPL